MIDYASMNQHVFEGHAREVEALTRQALDEGLPVDEVLQDGLIAGMSVVGEDFKRNRVYVPEVLIAARAMKAGLAVLEPLLTARGEQSSAGTLVMGTVKGDLHDIGKNLVCMMAEGAGFHVVNLGVNTSAEKFVAAAREHGADVVGMSALLTTTMVYMPTVIEALKQEGLEHVRVCVGGAPLSPAFAEQIGADGYAADAASAVELFRSLVAGRATADS